MNEYTSRGVYDLFICVTHVWLRDDYWFNCLYAYLCYREDHISELHFRPYIIYNTDFVIKCIYFFFISSVLDDIICCLYFPDKFPMYEFKNTKNLEHYFEIKKKHISSPVNCFLIYYYTECH